MELLDLITWDNFTPWASVQKGSSESPTTSTIETLLYITSTSQLATDEGVITWSWQVNVYVALIRPSLYSKAAMTQITCDRK